MSPAVSPTTPLFSLSEHHLRQLLFASQAFNSTLELEVLIPRILDLITETCEAEAGSIWVLHNGVLQCQYAVGPAAQDLMWVELPVGAGIVGDVARQRRAELIRDARADDRYLPQLDEITGVTTHSVIAAPLVAGGELYGALQLVNARTGATDLDEDDLRFVEAIADDAAAALRNASLFRAEKKARDLRALLEVSHEITSTFDLDRVLLSIVNLAGRALRFDRCVLAAWHDEKLRVQAISGEATIDGRATAIKQLERFLAWAAEQREIIAVRDLHDSEHEAAAHVRSHFADYVQSAALAAFVTVPIKDSEGELGLLLLEFTHPVELAQWELEATELLANQAALAIRNAQLYANVPFISWLEPWREKKKKLIALPGPVWLAYLGIGLGVVAALALVPIPTRVWAPSSEVRALVQRPARAQIDGVIETVLVQEGQFVTANTPVATLRNEELIRALRARTGEREIAERAALAADARGDRSAASLARVRHAEARDAETLFTRELQLATVRAPIAGIVLTQRLPERAGDYVEAGDTIAWIGDRDSVELELLVHQEDLGRIRDGARVTAKTSAYPNRRLAGHVFAIAPAATVVDGKPMYAVRARLDNRDQILRPGMSAFGKISAGWRPVAAVIFRRPWRWLRMHLWW